MFLSSVDVGDPVRLAPRSIRQAVSAFARVSAMLMQTLCKFAPRRYRVYRLISRLAADRFEVYRVEGGLIYLNLHEHPMMVQIAMGTYEPAKHAMIRRHLRPGMTFIDVGANLGYFTLQAAQSGRQRRPGHRDRASAGESFVPAAQHRAQRLQPHSRAAHRAERPRRLRQSPDFRAAARRILLPRSSLSTKTCPKSRCQSRP